MTLALSLALLTVLPTNPAPQAQAPRSQDSSANPHTTNAMHGKDCSCISCFVGYGRLYCAEPYCFTHVGVSGTKCALHKGGFGVGSSCLFGCTSLAKHPYCLVCPEREWPDLATPPFSWEVSKAAKPDPFVASWAAQQVESCPYPSAWELGNRMGSGRPLKSLQPAGFFVHCCPHARLISGACATHTLLLAKAPLEKDWIRVHRDELDLELIRLSIRSLAEQTQPTVPAQAVKPSPNPAPKPTRVPVSSGTKSGWWSPSCSIGYLDARPPFYVKSITRQNERDIYIQCAVDVADLFGNATELEIQSRRVPIAVDGSFQGSYYYSNGSTTIRISGRVSASGSIEGTITIDAGTPTFECQGGFLLR